MLLTGAIVREKAKQLGTVPDNRQATLQAGCTTSRGDIVSSLARCMEEQALPT
jgi:hypothetical protein